ncbi:MAG: DUF169 domain-containing protein [Spirochaetes bacterium]|nr:DUF169 domain-containing protein [Spirochaetota bacterium]
MGTIEDYRKSGDELFHALHLSTFPIAVRYIEDESEIPANALRPSRIGKKMSLCQAFTQSRNWGTTVAMTTEDNFCVPATAFHGWADISKEDLIESQVKQGWHLNREAEEKRISGAFHILQRPQDERKGKYTGFISSPLPNTAVVPHSILVYGSGKDITHIIHALSYDYETITHSFFEGFGESCVKGGLLPFVTGTPQVVVPGAGDRAFSGIGDHEIGIGFPAEMLFKVMKYLLKTGGGMISRSMRTMLPMHIDENITPGFKFLHDRISSKSK